MINPTRMQRLALAGILLVVVAVGGNAAAQTWPPTGSMTTPRYAHAAAPLPDGRILASGGSDGHVDLASAEVYDPAIGAWSATRPMASPRYAHAATPLPVGRVLVTGGVHNSFYVASAELYDPALDMWSPAGSMSIGRIEFTATALRDGRVLVSGGFTGGLFPVGYSASVEIYDPANNAWSLTGPMTTARYGHTAALLADGRVLVTGGYDGDAVLASAEIYDPAQGTWSPAASMNTARYFNTATALADGRVLVSGGSLSTNIDSVPVASSEVYDPVGNTWSLTGSMGTARAFHAATLRSDGRAIVSGGVSGHASGFNDSAEIYDPASGVWLRTLSMSTPREFHTATLLADGGVLVSGGSSDTRILASAEVFLNDVTAPQVLCAASNDTWRNTDAVIACAASDGESGLASADDASFTLTTSVPSGTETQSASTNSRRVCNTVGECSTAGPLFGNKVDKKPPTISIVSPAANATYQFNSNVGASYDCFDGGSGVASCQGPIPIASPIDTSSTGTKTFTVSASDAVGNPSTLTASYNVVAGGGGGATSADVGVTMTAPGKVSPGNTLTYSMMVTNGGKVTSTRVMVSDALPLGTAFAGAATSQGAITAPAVGRNGTVIVNLGDLAKGSTATVNIAVTVTAVSGTVLSNTATVTAATQDLNSSNNLATQKTTVSKN